MKKKIKLNASTKDFFRQMLPVLAGVLIALFLNNWNESRKDARFSKKVMEAAISEYQENYKDLKERITDHNAIYDTIDFYQDVDSVFLGHLINKTNGIELLTIKNTTFKAITNSNIQLIDLKILKKMISIEEFREAIDFQNKVLVDFIYENATSETPEAKMKYGLMLGDIIGSEKTALDEHKAYFEELSDKFTLQIEIDSL